MRLVVALIFFGQGQISKAKATKVGLKAKD